ncbi:MAG TPA: hypothetical protein VL096_16425, partial [Pirellulaceae bacterium]|nr:hypothetical protein [Pirellulaceae bacterium]
MMRITCLTLLLGVAACGFSVAQEPLQPARSPATAPSEKIDFDKARDLFRKQNSGGKLSVEEAAYLERAKAARRANERPPQDSRMLGGKESIGFKPLTEITGDDRYLGQDGGLYGGGKNTPPDEHRQAAEQALARIQPRNSAGEPASDGRIGFVSISMSNATQEFSAFKQLADADNAKASLVTIVDCAQGGQAMAEWVDPQARPWQEAERRLAAAKISDLQVQVAWIKLANKGPRGDLEEHGRKLEQDTLAVIQNAKAKFPNLQIAYLSSRIYGGYSSGALNPEPYAYESAFPARWLIQRQIKGDKALVAEGNKAQAPLLLWGPYLWADGITPRQADKLTYTREDLANDGTHPSQSGRLKV